MESTKQTVNPTLGTQAVGGDFQSVKAGKQKAAQLLRIFPRSNAMIIGASVDETLLPTVIVMNQRNEPVVVPLDFSLPLDPEELKTISSAVREAAPGKDIAYLREVVMTEIASSKHSIIDKTGKGSSGNSRASSKDKKVAETEESKTEQPATENPALGD